MQIIYDYLFLTEDITQFERDLTSELALEYLRQLLYFWRFKMADTGYVYRYYLAEL